MLGKYVLLATFLIYLIACSPTSLKHEKSKEPQAMDYYNIGHDFYKRKMINRAISKFKLVLTLNNDRKASAYSYSGLGLIYKEKEQYTTALNYLQQALKLSNNHIPTHKNIADIYFIQKNYSEAIKHYKQVIALDPTNSYVSYFSHFQLGRVYFKQSRFDLAIVEYKAALLIYPNDCPILFNLGLAHKEKKNKKEAISYFETYLLYASSDPTQTNRITDAEQLLAEIKHMQSSSNHMVTAKKLELDKKTKQIKAKFQNSTPDKKSKEEKTKNQHSPPKTKNHYLAGLTKMEQKEWSSAINEFKLVSNSVPNYKPAQENIAKAYFNLAMEYVESRDLTKAELSLNEALKHSSNKKRKIEISGIYYTLGIKQVEKNQEKAEKLFRKAMKLNPQLADSVNVKIGNIYYQKGVKHKEKNQNLAENLLKQSKVLNPLLASSANARIAEIYVSQSWNEYLKEGFTANIQKKMQKALILDSTSYDVHLTFGKIFFHKRDYEEALKHLENALKYNLNDDAEVYYRLGRVHHVLLKFPQKINSLYSEAIKRNSLLIGAYYWRGHYYFFNKNDKVEAKNDFEKLIAVTKSLEVKQKLSEEEIKYQTKALGFLRNK